jgi:hypothetical protein
MGIEEAEEVDEAEAGNVTMMTNHTANEGSTNSTVR